jgi:Transketolase, thiamine diphosphate binding domain
MMEGVTQEACSLAGHWGLGKLICFYDDNKISIDGNTDIAFTDDTVMRFKSLGWQARRSYGMLDETCCSAGSTASLGEAAGPFPELGFSRGNDQLQISAATTICSCAGRCRQQRMLLQPGSGSSPQRHAARAGDRGCRWQHRRRLHPQGHRRGQGMHGQADDDQGLDAHRLRLAEQGAPPRAAQLQVPLHTQHPSSFLTFFGTHAGSPVVKQHAERNACDAMLCASRDRFAVVQVNSYAAHGAPLGADETKLTREQLKWDHGEFEVPEGVMSAMAERRADAGAAAEAEWQKGYDEWKGKYGEEAKELEAIVSGNLDPSWSDALPTFTAEDKPLATRAHSQARRPLARSRT